MQRGKFRPNLEPEQRVKLVKVDYDTDYRADVKAMERAITKNTCLLIGSAPEYPHGLIDDLEAISNIAVKYDIPMHVGTGKIINCNQRIQLSLS